MHLTASQARNLAYIKNLGIQLPALDTVEVGLFQNETLLPVEQRILITTEAGITKIQLSSEFLFYRAVFIGLPRLAQSKEGRYEERTSIVETSFSLDASRNGVMKVAVVKEFIARLALLGYNTLYLYTEDTYQVPGLPYLGYLRGAYTADEIKEITSFAADFGMEVVPAIQTLAHLTQFLKWPASEALKDDANTMLIGEEATYEAIDQMLAACKDMYQTNRIHLGMDEAYQAGLGRYLALHGYKDRVTLMLEHMKRVLDLSVKHQLKAEIWSDFIYKLLDKTKADRYYNPLAQMDPQEMSRLPQGLTYVHWDYGSESVAEYEQVIQKHLAFCDREHYVLASGTHIWNRIAPNHGKTQRIIAAALAAARKQQIKKVMLTTWGDDGQETEHWHALPGAVAFAEGVYANQKSGTVETLLDNLLSAGAGQLLTELNAFDEVDNVTAGNPNMTNISKLLLWQDPLTGIYDWHVAAHNEQAPQTLGAYYRKLAEKLTTASDQNSVKKGQTAIHETRTSQTTPFMELIRQRYQLLAEVLADKAELGLRLRAARLAEDQNQLHQMITALTNLAEKVERLCFVHEKIWSATYKTFGWEELEHRYAGTAHRLKTTARRLSDYLAGSDELAELLEKRLPFCEGNNPIEISGFGYRQGSVTGYN
ncbi:beta-N-acetylhexosaminidase [Candidatus Enterococcus leclercqii]|uniref:beta-N-acetylhexosaminidase n=1 Tax=Candidatus Enterococcus leclercqii TaxID=1857218 RepID=UPI00137A8B17|nr:beta-N-acetylhexosaminidase [Enterococcus sp. CU9D]KAF1291307.1 glycoside hydrolase family 20 [Enterococcus sp. CU9D]